MRRTTTRALAGALAAALAAALVLLAGCGGDDDPDGAPSPTDGGTPSAESGPADPTPTAPTAPTVEPAAGITLSLPNSTVRAPEGWTEAEVPVPTQVGADGPQFASAITLGEIDAFGQAPTADEMAQIRLDSNVYTRKPKVLPTVELDGVEAYHVAGAVSGHQWIEEYGAVVNDRIVTLTFDFNADVPEGEREEIVASVLPTFAWL